MTPTPRAPVHAEAMVRPRTDGAADLEAEPSLDQRWEAVARRDDPIAQIIGAVHGGAPTHVDRAVRRILQQVDGYERTGTVERDDLWWSVDRNLDAVLLAVAEERPPSRAELAVRRELGRRRAQQGMSVEDIMRAFRVGYGVLWEVLSETADTFGPAHARALLDRAARILMTFDEITSVVAEAHAEVVARQHLDRRRRALGFLTGLLQLPEDQADTESLCRSLGLNPHASFTVAVHDVDGAPSVDDDDTVTIEQMNRTLVITAWDGGPIQSEVLLGDRLAGAGGTHVGVGMTRQGLPGALQSLRDAEWAHELARSCGEAVVRFRDHWLGCLAMQDRAQLDALAAPVVQALRHHDGLRDTLQTYLDCAGNLSAAGKQLGVHANTVAFRLRQLTDQTGVDVRTPDGMALVQVAFAHAGSEGVGTC